jgi:nicotinamidase-related amidase
MNQALLIIDMQKDFVLPGSPLCVAGAMGTVPRIREALDVFRETGGTVFHVVREYRQDGSDVEQIRLHDFQEGQRFVVPGTPGCEIVDELTPLPSEYRLVKNRFSAFMQTELDFMLRRLGIGELVICGTQYPACIRCTAFDAVAYGYEVTVLTDAASAQSEIIAAANILDMRNIGIQCVTVQRFKELRK